MSRAALGSLGVFVVLLLLVVSTRDDRTSVGLRTLELPQVSAEEVTRIEIGGSTPAILQREGDAWLVEDPAAPGVTHPAEAAPVERLLGAIAKLEVSGFVTARPEKHAELEIDDDTGTTLEVTSNGKVVLDLVLGRRAKNGGDLLRLRDTDAVFVASGAVASAARRSAEDWRRHDMLDVEVSDIQSLTIQRRGEPAFRLVKATDDGGSWSLAAGTELPPGFQLDQTAAARIASSLARLRADGFVDDDPGEAQTGLSSRATRVVAFGADGGTVAELRLGAADDASRVHASVAGDPQIYLVAKTAADQVAPSLAELRDLSLLTADPEQVVALEVRGADEPVAVEKRDGAWQLLQPDPPPAEYEFDGSRVQGRISVLTRTRGTHFLGAEGEVEADFSSPLELELRFADDSRRVISFGGQLGEDDDPGTQEVAVKPGNGFVYAIRAFERNRYEKPLALFERVEPAAPPPGAGGMQGLENLPPDIRRQIEEQLRQQGR